MYKPIPERRSMQKAWGTSQFTRGICIWIRIRQDYCNCNSNSTKSACFSRSSLRESERMSIRGEVTVTILYQEILEVFLPDRNFTKQV
mmetsp:Transcript_12225/g.17540  ORF Transcript_12225/g.17540 Transcript_12225/m.17540 type:complete len:88 (-) Transcript_12225:12-275(-)